MLGDGHWCQAALLALQKEGINLAVAVKAASSWTSTASKTSDRYALSFFGRLRILTAFSYRSSGRAGRGRGPLTEAQFWALGVPCRAATSLLGSLQDSIDTALDWCDDAAPPRPAAMTAEVGALSRPTRLILRHFITPLRALCSWAERSLPSIWLMAMPVRRH